MNRARPAAATGAMHVEERDAITLAQVCAIEAAQRTSDPIERAGGDMSGDDRIGHP
jgi:hypothetical protein